MELAYVSPMLLVVGNTNQMTACNLGRWDTSLRCTGASLKSLRPILYTVRRVPSLSTASPVSAEQFSKRISMEPRKVTHQ